MNKKTRFNLMITGVGGQGVITLLRIIGETALAQGYDVRTSELHGLSQKGGTVQAHARFGRQVFSPLVQKGTADLIIAMEMIEALRILDLSGRDTRFLINKKYIAFRGAPEEREIAEKFRLLGQRAVLINASDICAKELGKEIFAGTYLLSLAILKGMIPIKQDSLFAGLKGALKPEYLDLNKKVFKLAQNAESA